MDSLRNIVVGVDFFSFSRNALAQAMRIARWNEARLHVIHVVDEAVMRDMQETMESLPLRARKDWNPESACDAAQRQLDEWMDTVDAETLRLTAQAVIGNPFVEILRRVQSVSADLLVLGSNGSSDPARGAGTLATKCVRKAAAKVLLVRQGSTRRFGSVVACVDFSEMSDRVIEQAVRVAQQDGARLHVLHVFSRPWDTWEYVDLAAELEEDYREVVMARLRDYLERFTTETAELQVERHLIEDAREARAIVEFIEEVGAGLAVVGTQGRTGLRVILLGTVAERIVRESSCCVLAIKPDDFGYRV
ncbi:MAG: universal stress protein [Phycisphaerae bacterium]